MKIAFICDYYFPFEVSGAEVSSRILAEELAKSGEDMIVITPKYGDSPSEEIKEKVKIFRFPFLSKKRINSLPPYIVNNPLWHIYAAIEIYKIAKREKPNIIHVQNKNLFIPAVIANVLLHKPIIATARDYRYLCDLGVCLLKVNPRICNFREYFYSDIPQYIKLYKHPTLSVFFMSYMIGIYSYFFRHINKFLLRRIDKVICVSRAVEKIYNQAGVKNTATIYNLMRFENIQFERKKKILFVGRFTPGKGKEILIQIIPEFLSKHPDWQFILVSRDIVEISHNRLTQIEYLPHNQLINLMSTVSLLIIPSLWPEPLSRAALDALSVGTPVIASRNGGMTEIIDNGLNGYLADYTGVNFLKKIDLAIKNIKKMTFDISKNKVIFEKKFYTGPSHDYKSLYNGLVSKE